MLTQEYFDEWNKKYEDAKADLNNREERMAKCVEELEADMELLGVTGVEDRL